MTLPFSNIIITGSDAANFLQGQITADIFNLSPPCNNPSHMNQGLAGICNIKGRLITIFWISKKTDCIHLTLPSELALSTIAHLQKYVFRSNVAFELEQQVETNHILNFKDIPWITLTNQARFLPQALNLDCLNGVNFKKGCYTGQEIIARMHYLGQNKRRMIACTIATTLNTHALKIGDPISITDQKTDAPVGEIIFIHTTHILIALQLSALSHLLYCGPYQLIQQKLPYFVPELEESV